MQTVYARCGAGGGSQQREVADGDDVVFTGTVSLIDLIYIPNYVEIAKSFVDGRMYGRTNGQSDCLYNDDSKESS